MSTAKSLSDDQISTIRAWVEGGDGFAEVQQKLASEMEIKVTYLETRFLLEDLKIELLPPPEPVVEEVEEEAAEETEAAAPEEAAPGAGGVSITMDQVLRPEALVSGKAHFAGGNTISWWLDQMGQLGMDSENPDFRPNEEEMVAFQTELRAAIQKSGL